MPWVSDQQRKWGHSPAGVKALGGEDAVKEWDAATGDTSLSNKAPTSHWPGAQASIKKKGSSGGLYRRFEPGY